MLVLRNFNHIPLIEDIMNIGKADAIAQLSRWYNAASTVRATYRSGTGDMLIIGKLSELSPSAVTIRGDGCEMLLYFKDTSEYEYNDARAPNRDGHIEQENKYPIFINVTFSNGDHLELCKFSANDTDS